MRIFNKSELNDNLSHIYIVASMVLFWTIFDTILMYMTPIILSEHGLSNSMLGMIIASSSVFGAIFDILLCKILNNSNFKKIFFYMFILSVTFPLVLIFANTIPLFILAMAIWGIYFDLYGIGIFDFIGKTTSEKYHSSSFGIIQVFRSIGLFIGPIVVGAIVSDKIGIHELSHSWIFLFVAFLLFLVLIMHINKKKISHGTKKKNKNFILELVRFRKLSSRLFSPLLITFFVFFVESFFWTLGPLIASQKIMSGSGGLFIALYCLPSIFVGWFVGRITSKFGKKKTAISSIIIGSLFLLIMSFISNQILMLALIFLASIYFGIALPSINGAYADYIYETSTYEEEIEALEDLSFNLAYICGPLCAGILSDIFGITRSFGILGIFGIFLGIFLLKITPKSISVKRL